MKVIVILVLVIALLFSGYLHDSKTNPAPQSFAELSEPVPEYLPVPSLDPRETERSKPEPAHDTRHWSEKEIEAPAVPMDGGSAPEGMVKLNELPVYYPAADAEKDGCVVYAYDENDNYVQLGSNVWDTFVDKVSKGEPAMVRRVEDYSGYSYAEGDYTKTSDIEYDGQNYTVRRYYYDKKLAVSYEILDIYSPITDWDRENNALVKLYADRSEAEKDGCVIFKGNEELYSGKEKLEEFFLCVTKGEPARVRIVNQSYSANDIYDVYQVEFDGVNFIYTADYSDEFIKTSVYPYMLTFDAPSHGGIQYILCHSEDYKWSDITAKWGKGSSMDEDWLSYNRAFVIPVEDSHEAVQP